VRFVATFLLWVLTTAALVVAIPATWAQHNVVDRNGFSQLATSAAKDPNVQSAMAGVLTTQLVKLAGSSGYDVSPNLLSGAARSYTTSSAFPGQFALANQLVHRWLFTDTVAQSDESGRWELDLSPMLSDARQLRHQGSEVTGDSADRERVRFGAARPATAGGEVGSVGQRWVRDFGRRARTSDPRHGAKPR